MKQRREGVERGGENKREEENCVMEYAGARLSVCLSLCLPYLG